MAYHCCCASKSATFDPLLETSDNDSRSQKQHVVIETKHSPPVATVAYEPPQIENNSIRRLSLPSAPAQHDALSSLFTKNQYNPMRHPIKSGFLKKQGHIVKSMKRRFFVLQGTIHFI